MILSCYRTLQARLGFEGEKRRGDHHATGAHSQNGELAQSLHAADAVVGNLGAVARQPQDESGIRQSEPQPGADTK